MAIVRVDVNDTYGRGEIWTDAGTEDAAMHDVETWCDANPPWEIRGQVPARGDDGHYKILVERAYLIPE